MLKKKKKEYFSEASASAVKKERSSQHNDITYSVSLYYMNTNKNAI